MSKAQKPFALHPVAVNRLTKLADFLAVLPVESFDIGSWTNTADHNEENDSLLAKDGLHLLAGLSPKKAIDCGTTCCAAGWGGTIPSFVRAGFRIQSNAAGDGWVSYTDPTGKKRVGFDACAAFFRVSHDVAEHFFSPENYNYARPTTPFDVAIRIRNFVKSPVGHAKRWNLDLA